MIKSISNIHLNEKRKKTDDEIRLFFCCHSVFDEEEKKKNVTHVNHVTFFCSKKSLHMLLNIVDTMITYHYYLIEYQLTIHLI